MPVKLASMALGASLLCCSARLGAQDADELGFSDVEAPPQPSAASPSPSPDGAAIELGATLRFQGVVRPTFERVANARQLLELHLDVRQELGDARLRVFAAAHGEVDYRMLADPEGYDRETFDTYAWNVRPGEIYLAFEWRALELRVGEQIFNLGQGEVLSVLDLMNPRDLREPLLTDPDYVRLPLLASRLGLAFDRTRLDVVVVHEPYFGLRAPPLGEWSPFRKLLLEDPRLGPALDDRTLRNQHLPEHRLLDLDATQLHARSSWSGEGVDLALLASNLLDPIGVPTLPRATEFEEPVVDVPIVHSRYALFGHAGAYALGPCLLRWELAFEHERPVSVRRTNTPLERWDAARSNALRGLLGLTYAPSSATQVGFEAAQLLLLDALPPRSALLFPLEAPQFALRVSQKFWSERFELAGVGLLIGLSPVNAWAARIELAYAPADDLQLGLGYVTYHPSDRFGVFYGFERNDSLFFELRWTVSR